MKSLRTEDIIGATPRVRHMPKTLYRQQRSYLYNHSVEYSPIKDYETYYKEMGGKWDHSYNQNIYGNYPLSQYDPQPFLKQPQLSQNSYPNSRLNQSTKYQQKNYPITHQQFLQYQSSQSLEMSQPNSYSQYQSQMPRKVEQRYSGQQQRNVKRKQGLLTNYEQLKQLQNMKNNEREIKEQSYQTEPNMKASQNYGTSYRQNPEDNNTNKQTNNPNSNLRQSLIEPNQSIKSAREMNSRSSSSQHSASMNASMNAQEKQERNIFRGIGFNIITNSKYQYNLQTTNPYMKKPK